MSGVVASVNTSAAKGDKKTPVFEAMLVAGVGIDGDAHAGGIRQVSLLARESVERCAAKGLNLCPGDFGENLTVENLDLGAVRVGQRLLVGSEAVLQISEIGKTCGSPCSIGQRLGDCIMPSEGVFAKVVRGGRVRPGYPIEPTTVKAGAVLTSSDRCARGEREDESGRLLVQLLDQMDVVLSDYSILPDEEVALSEKLVFLADRCAVDLVLTTGGTGFGVRDRMPEATTAVLNSQAHGIAEAIRREGTKHTPFACLSRGVSGLRGRTLIVNLPGSSRAIVEVFELLRAVLPHALEVLRSEVADCGPLRHKDIV